MAKFFTKVITALKSTRALNQTIKAVIILALLLSGFFFEPLVIAGTALLILLIALENDIKSLYYIAFFFPTGVAFYYHVTDIFYFASVFFTIWHLMKHMISIEFKVHKDILLISVFTFCLYLLISQLIGNADYDRVGMIAHLVFLLFVCTKNFKSLTLKKLALFLSAGILVSASLGLLKAEIQKLIDLIPNYNRFPGLMTNPNSFYTLALAALSALCVLYVRRQITRYTFFSLFAVLTVIGLSSLSRAFIIIYIPLTIGFIFCKLWRVRKERIHIGKVSIFVASIVAAIVIAYLTPQFRAVMDRLIQSVKDVETLGDPARYELWELYITNWLSSAKNIIFGIGFAPPTGIDGMPATTVHNAALVLICQTGIIGTLLFCTMFFFLIKFIYNSRCFKIESFLPLFALAGFCMVETVLFKFQFYLFVLIIILCTAQKEIEPLHNQSASKNNKVFKHQTNTPNNTTSPTPCYHQKVTATH